MIIIGPSTQLDVEKPGWGSNINKNSPIICYDNIVSAGSVTASEGEDVDHPVSNVEAFTTFDYWLSPNTDEQTLICITGTTELNGYLAICKHNFASAGIAVKAQGQKLDTSVVDLTTAVVPDNDGPLIFRYEPLGLADVRLHMASGGSAAPYVGVMRSGSTLVLQRRIYIGHIPITLGGDPDIVGGMSERGDFIGRIMTGESHSTAVNMKNLTPAWVRAYLEPFLIAAREEPFFFSWRPDGYPLETGYVWLTNNPKPINDQGNGLMKADLQMSGIVS